MRPEEFTKALHKKAHAVEQYAQTKFPTMAGDLTLRFIDGNFRVSKAQVSKSGKKARELSS